MKVAALRLAGVKDHRAFAGAAPAYITESAAGINTTQRIEGAKTFVDQAAVDSYVTARGGNTAQFVAVDFPL